MLHSCSDGNSVHGGSPGWNNLYFHWKHTMDLLLGFEGRFAFGEISKILKFRVDSAASFEV